MEREFFARPVRCQSHDLVIQRSTGQAAPSAAIAFFARGGYEAFGRLPGAEACSIASEIDGGSDPNRYRVVGGGHIGAEAGNRYRAVAELQLWDASIEGSR